MFTDTISYNYHLHHFDLIFHLDSISKGTWFVSSNYLFSKRWSINQFFFFSQNDRTSTELIETFFIIDNTCSHPNTEWRNLLLIVEITICSVRIEFIQKSVLWLVRKPLSCRTNSTLIDKNTALCTATKRNLG